MENNEILLNLIDKKIEIYEKKLKTRIMPTTRAIYGSFLRHLQELKAKMEELNG